MLEGLAMILAGVAGYANWPWWWAAILGAFAGATNASRRVFTGPWRFQFEGSDTQRARALAVLAVVCLWTSAMCALLFTGIWLVVRWTTEWLT
jgi:hypothetical protein